MRFKINLEGKTALVTGAARGIRRASALMLAGEGGRVVIATRDAEGTERVASEIEGLGGTALPVRTDVTAPTA